MPDFFNTGGAVFFFSLLFEIADRDVFSQLTGTFQRWNQSKDTFNQGCLSDTVCSGQGDLVSSFQREIQRLRERFLIADDKIFCLKNVFSRSAPCFKMKFRFWLLSGQFYDIHLIQFFLAGHGHISGGHSCLITGDEIF